MLWDMFSLISIVFYLDDLIFLVFFFFNIYIFFFIKHSSNKLHIEKQTIYKNTDFYSIAQYPNWDSNKLLHIFAKLIMNMVTI